MARVRVREPVVVWWIVLNRLSWRVTHPFNVSCSAWKWAKPRTIVLGPGQNSVKIALEGRDYILTFTPCLSRRVLAFWLIFERPVVLCINPMPSNKGPSAYRNKDDSCRCRHGPGLTAYVI
jgi:hypothetical protein